MPELPDHPRVVVEDLDHAALHEERVHVAVGVKRDAAPQVPGELWADFALAAVHPDLANVHFIARAITPPRRPKRFDARFFTADASAVAHRIEGIVGPESELIELVWVPIEEATKLDMPTITGIILSSGIDSGMMRFIPM